jgi:chorismate mutase
MRIDLNDIRVRLDQQTERIISGLKDRSRYLSNHGVFDKPFAEGLSWFGYRLREEQSLDSAFGRYDFEDQHPILFKKEALTQPKIRRARQEQQLIPVSIDFSLKIIQFYKELLNKICRQGEDPNTYGETVKLDVNNVLCLYERICGIGPYVAESKLRRDHSLAYVVDPEDIRVRLVHSRREEEVIEKAFQIAERYEMPNPESVRWVFRRIIDLTLDDEVAYIQAVQKKEEKLRTPPGWGQEPRKEGNGSKGWGCR